MSAGSSEGNKRGSSSYRRLAPPSVHMRRLTVKSFATMPHTFSQVINFSSQEPAVHESLKVEHNTMVHQEKTGTRMERG